MVFRCGFCFLILPVVLAPGYAFVLLFFRFSCGSDLAELGSGLEARVGVGCAYGGRFGHLSYLPMVYVVGERVVFTLVYSSR